MSKIIADCSRPESCSIVVLNKNNELEYFGIENQQKQTIKSNIYLGKITRVEYSLQAAFVEYGGDRAGFLPFSEIHPNYYHIPLKDKQELSRNDRHENTEYSDADDGDIERQPRTHQKKYSIQEVIKRGQVVLVQVIKDERGNKGVSLTTYISLIGRYCVFMPNSNSGIVLSKKISSYEDRKKILNSTKQLNIEEGTGLIVRTEAVKAEDNELNREYQNLCNLWRSICEKLSRSRVGDGPIYQEANIVKQVVRDYHESDENSQIIIKGKDGYNDVVDFIKKIMPSELSKVKQYNGSCSLFKKYEIDKKLDALLEPTATLPSGGYLVISPTEALVSIDVNSGHSIHAKDVEETALQTNIEAAWEIAKQLRLRNLGGLIVVDFIDMNQQKNKHILERELQKAFMFDKAKVQIARISQFGLVEISRQRMRSNVIEIMTVKCDHCNGTGNVKAPSIVSTDILDSIDEAMRSQAKRKNFLEVMACPDVINCLVVNHIKEIEAKQEEYGIKIITKKHDFGKNEEYILRGLDAIGDGSTAEELYHAIVAKFSVASDEKRKTNKTFMLLATKIFANFFKKPRRKHGKR